MAKAKQEQAPVAEKQEQAPVAEPAALPEGVIAWVRPSGAAIQTNDQPETVAHCEAQGWKRA